MANFSDLAKTPVRVTIEGTMEDVLRRLKLSRPESVALTAFALKDGQVRANMNHFITMTMEVVK